MPFDPATKYAFVYSPWITCVNAQFRVVIGNGKTKFNDGLEPGEHLLYLTDGDATAGDFTAAQRWFLEFPDFERKRDDPETGQLVWPEWHFTVEDAPYYRGVMVDADNPSGIQVEADLSAVESGWCAWDWFLQPSADGDPIWCWVQRRNSDKDIRIEYTGKINPNMITRKGGTPWKGMTESELLIKQEVRVPVSIADAFKSVIVRDFKAVVKIPDDMTPLYTGLPTDKTALILNGMIPDARCHYGDLPGNDYVTSGPTTYHGLGATPQYFDQFIGPFPAHGFDDFLNIDWFFDICAQNRNLWGTDPDNTGNPISDFLNWGFGNTMGVRGMLVTRCLEMMCDLGNAIFDSIDPAFNFSMNNWNASDHHFSEEALLNEVGGHAFLFTWLFGVPPGNFTPIADGVPLTNVAQPGYTTSLVNPPVAMSFSVYTDGSPNIGNVILHGTDASSAVISETLTLNNKEIIRGTLKFLTLTSVDLPAGNGTFYFYGTPAISNPISFSDEENISTVLTVFARQYGCWFDCSDIDQTTGQVKVKLVSYRADRGPLPAAWVLSGADIIEEGRENVKRAIEISNRGNELTLRVGDQKAPPSEVQKIELRWRTRPWGPPARGQWTKDYAFLDTKKKWEEQFTCATVYGEPAGDGVASEGGWVMGQYLYWNDERDYDIFGRLGYFYPHQFRTVGLGLADINADYTTSIAPVLVGLRGCSEKSVAPIPEKRANTLWGPGQFYAYEVIGNLDTGEGRIRLSRYMLGNEDDDKTLAGLTPNLTFSINLRGVHRFVVERITIGNRDGVSQIWAKQIPDDYSTLPDLEASYIGEARNTGGGGSATGGGVGGQDQNSPAGNLLGTGIGASIGIDADPATDAATHFPTVFDKSAVMMRGVGRVSVALDSETEPVNPRRKAARFNVSATVDDPCLVTIWEGDTAAPSSPGVTMNALVIPPSLPAVVFDTSNIVLLEADTMILCDNAITPNPATGFPLVYTPAADPDNDADTDATCLIEAACWGVYTGGTFGGTSVMLWIVKNFAGTPVYYPIALCPSLLTIGAGNNLPAFFLRGSIIDRYVRNTDTYSFGISTDDLGPAPTAIGAYKTRFEASYLRKAIDTCCSP